MRSYCQRGERFALKVAENAQQKPKLPLIEKKLNSNKKKLNYKFTKFVRYGLQLRYAKELLVVVGKFDETVCPTCCQYQRASNGCKRISVFSSFFLTIARGRGDRCRLSCYFFPFRVSV